MKRLQIYSITFLFLVLMPQQEVNANYQQYGRGNAILRFIANHPSLRKYSLYTILAMRCNRYMPLIEASYCKEAVARQVEILDFDILFTDTKTSKFNIGQKSWSPDSFVFVAYRKKLLELLNSEKTTEYLSNLNPELSRFQTNENPNFNVWEYTKKYTESTFEAAYTIAALFQDTSDMKLHIAYIEKKFPNNSKVFNKNKELLEQVISTINLILDYNENSYGLLFYPREVAFLETKNIYHFYVPFSLALILKQEGFSDTYAVAAPLMMTIVYEFITLAGDTRYIFEDPEYLKIEEHEKVIQDIYSGYVGPMFATKQINKSSSYGETKKLFTQSTFRAIYSLIFEH